MQVEPPADDLHLVALCRKIERDRGFFCSSYKDTCLRRRISVRMRVKGASSFQEYGSILDADPLEYERLIATLTINVSKFFRDPGTFASILCQGASGAVRSGNSRDPYLERRVCLGRGGVFPGCAVRPARESTDPFAVAF